MPVRAVLDSRPHPQAVFEREDGEREYSSDRRPAHSAAELRHRLECDRDQIDNDKRHQRAVDEDADAVATGPSSRI